MLRYAHTILSASRRLASRHPMFCNPCTVGPRQFYPLRNKRIFLIVIIHKLNLFSNVARVTDVHSIGKSCLFRAEHGSANTPTSDLGYIGLCNIKIPIRPTLVVCLSFSYRCAININGNLDSVSIPFKLNQDTIFKWFCTRRSSSNNICSIFKVKTVYINSLCCRF